MKDKIQEVHDYFVGKIIKGQYKLVEVDQYTMKIIIDRKYNFTIWIANGMESVRTYDDGSYTNLTFTDPAKEKAWIHLEKYRKKDYEKVQRAKDEKELERLTQKLKP